MRVEFPDAWRQSSSHNAAEVGLGRKSEVQLRKMEESENSKSDPVP